MIEKAITPVLDLPTLVVQSGLIPSHRRAVEECKQGNIYVEVLPDDPERSYWVRLDRHKEGVFVLPSRTRLKWVDEHGQVHIAAIVPRPGRLPSDVVTQDDESSV